MYKISVVIPIYNVEKYIDQCIESVIEQDYDNLEIILVDDGSEDNCGEICDEYAKVDERIIVIHQKNAGLSAARNTGISIATGDYIAFVDSDDYIYKDMYSFLIKKIIKFDADIICCGYDKLYDNGVENKYNKENFELLMDSDEAISKILYTQFSESYAWNKLYKKSLFDNIRYPIGKLYEDIYTTYKLYDKAKKIIFNSSNKYVYRIRNGSITSQSFSLKSIDLINGLDEMYEFSSLKYPLIVHNMDAGYVVYFLTVINNMIISNEIHKEYVYKLRKFIKQNYFHIMNSSFISKTIKLKIFLYKMSFCIYKTIYSVYKRK